MHTVLHTLQFTWSHTYVFLASCVFTSFMETASNGGKFPSPRFPELSPCLSHINSSLISHPRHALIITSLHEPRRKLFPCFSAVVAFVYVEVQLFLYLVVSKQYGRELPTYLCDLLHQSSGTDMVDSAPRQIPDDTNFSQREAILSFAKYFRFSRQRTPCCTLLTSELEHFWRQYFLHIQE
jgi:hypothetical protein